MFGVFIVQVGISGMIVLWITVKSVYFSNDCFYPEAKGFYVFFVLLEYFFVFWIGLMPNVVDCDIVVSEFEIQSRYVHFQTITLG